MARPSIEFFLNAFIYAAAGVAAYLALVHAPELLKYVQR